ncbi:MAG: anthranilate phosphoribosyltransferase, partial [Thermoanaerobaculia bacterium]
VYHAAMKSVAGLRRELGIRTIFNLAGPLANPLGVKRQIVGVDRPARVEVMAQALVLLGTVRAFVFSNEAAGDELLPIGATRIAEVKDGRVRMFTVTASDFGLSAGEPEHIGGGDAERNAMLLRRVLDGEPGTARETVLMNASAALVVAGLVEDFRDGVGLAARSIDSGAARAALVALAAISRSNPGFAA